MSLIFLTNKIILVAKHKFVANIPDKYFLKSGIVYLKSAYFAPHYNY